MIEQGIERFIYGGRWVLAPMYFILIFVLCILFFKFGWDALVLVSHIIHGYEFNEIIIGLLELLDLTLVANLILVIAISGYENFVSKIDYAEHHKDRPKWMGRLDYSGLKLKIISSVVAISLIELLQDFLYISPRTVNPEVEFWRIAIHVIFVLTGVAFAGMEILSEKRHEIKDKDVLVEETTAGLKKY